MMSGGSEEPQHITEQIEICKKQLHSHSNFYSKLPQFLYKNKMIQSDMLNEIYERNSLLEGLLREMIELELNEETLRQVSSSSSFDGHNNQQSGQHKCTCPFCNRNPDEEEYWDDEKEDE
jgi:hypothetical protein